MKIKEMRQKSDTELQELLKEEQDKLRRIRFDLAAGQIKNISEIKKTKNVIARVKTLLKEQEYKK